MKPNIIKWNNEFGEEINGWYIRPDTQTKAAICLSHGFGEHSSRYQGLAQMFASEGYAFLAWDHAGHGRSGGRRGHIRAMGQYLAEIDTAIGMSSMLFSGAPIVLYGHSMGGNIAINYAIEKQERIGLLFITSPWLELAKPIPPFLRVLVKMLSRIAPRLTLKAPLDAKAITHVEDEVYKYAHDPLNHTKISARLLDEITKMGQFAIQHARSIRVPTLFFHGTCDSITSMAATSRTAQTMEFSSFVPWEGMYHELHNETVRQQVFSMAIEWLNGNLETFGNYE